MQEFLQELYPEEEELYSREERKIFVSFRSKHISEYFERRNLA